MNKKRGFTLIELLAVILILGIIALIAIPTVNKVLDESKKNAFKTTLNNIEKKVTDTCSIQQLNGKAITTSYTIANGTISPSVDIKGKLPNGTISLDNKCGVTYELSDNTYTGTKETASGTVEIVKNNQSSSEEPKPTPKPDPEPEPEPELPKEPEYLTGTYKESLLNGADPMVEVDMIPVTIANNGVVTKADINSKWYEYGNSAKNWANVVLVNDSTRATYKSASAGSTINQSDILAYLVWIPRFKYAIPTVSSITSPPSINIVFENKKTVKSTGSAIGTNYYTHPAFTFGTTELNGFWVAKFETTGTDENPTSIPNVDSLDAQLPGEQFETAKKFKNYGTRNDAHMMKNSEWGAVAYLSHSIYGTNKQVRVNNYWIWGDGLTKTGCGASIENDRDAQTCGIIYGNVTDYPQSTTGNISGIFDMSGGCDEQVMGIYKAKFDNAGFTEIPDSKYYDNYTGSNTELTYETACSNGPCKGHAGYETKNWYNDSYYVASSDGPWVIRGGNATRGADSDPTRKLLTGVFSTSILFADRFQGMSFRVSITEG